MLTRREVVIEKPFRDRRYKDHRRKVRSALPRIDVGPPPDYPHLVVKLKKLRLERDRQGKICEDNIRLAHRMAIIMRTKRLDNVNTAPRGPFERRGRSSSRLPCRDDDERGPPPPPGGSFLERVTSEAERRLGPPPPGRLVQHRAPAGLCRVPRVGPPPSPSGGRRDRASGRKWAPAIVLPLASPRPRRSPSPERRLRRRRRETAADGPTTPPPDRRRPSVTASLPSPQDDDEEEDSSSAEDDGDDDGLGEESDKSEEEEEEEATGSPEEGEEESSRQDANECETTSEEEGKSEKTDSDDRVSSILLSRHPNITIDEASDDEFYS